MTNREKTRRISAYFIWISTLMAIVLHLAFVQKLEYKPKPYQLREEEVIEIFEAPPEIDIPPPPKEIANPVVDVAAEPEESEEVDEDVTITETNFNVDAPPPPPPPPPKVEKPAAPKFVLAFDEKPETLHSVKPKYPELARNAGIEGVVLLVIIVKEDGTVGDVEVAKSLGFGCDEAAVAAIKQWKFTPGKQNDKPVPVKISIPVRFKLDN